MKIAISIILVVLSISSSVILWHETGDIGSDDMAQKILEDDAPEVLDKANELLNLIPDCIIKFRNFKSL